MPERHSFMKTPQSHVAALSFVIPVYNEQETIVQLCNHILDVMKRENISAYEIIFIDDGSIDHSWLRMQELYAQNP
ncbi:glycosyltransferase, partial [candidate division KSB3 bacterium]